MKRLFFRQLAMRFCPSFFQSIFLHVCLSVCLPVCLCIFMCVRLSGCLSFSLSKCLCVCMLECLSCCQFGWQSVDKKAITIKNSNRRLWLIPIATQLLTQLLTYFRLLIPTSPPFHLTPESWIRLLAFADSCPLCVPSWPLYVHNLACYTWNIHFNWQFLTSLFQPAPLYLQYSLSSSFCLPNSLWLSLSVCLYLSVSVCLSVSLFLSKHLWPFSYGD